MKTTRRDLLKGVTLGSGGLVLSPLIGQLAAQANDAPATLREQVTSPGGTTAAALGVLMGDDRLQNLMTDAIRAARDRGVELAKG